MNAKKLYWELVRKNKVVIAILTFLSCALALLVIAFAYLSKLLLDSIGKDAFVTYAILMGVIILLEAGLKLGMNMFFARTRIKLENSLKKQTLFAFFDNDFHSIDERSRGDWLNRLSNDVSVVADGVITYLPEFISLCFRIAMSFAVVAFIDWRFALALLSLGIIAYFASRIVRPKSKAYHKSSQEAAGEALGFFVDAVHNAFLLKLFSRLDRIESQCDAVQEKYGKARIRFANFSLFINTTFTFFMRLSYLGALVYASILIAKSNGTMGYGNLLVMIQLISQIEGPFSSLSGLLPKYYATLGSLERLPRKNEENKPELQQIQDFSSLTVSSCSFGYKDGKPLFEDLSFTIDKGQFALIYGPSGKGKTSLLKVLMGAYKPNKGSVSIAGMDTIYLTNLFAYVPQGNYLLPTSIRENLTLFGEADDQAIFEALKLVCLEDKIASLPEGLSTRLFDLGSGFSEGEGQRLSIARAYLSKRPILVLDECTSALDEATSRKVLSNLKATGKTIVLVSHKAESKEYADEVIYL